MRTLLKRPFLIRWALVFATQLALTFFLAKLCQKAWPEHALGNFSVASGDHRSYIVPMENLIAEGRYFFINPAGDMVLAGRMPHYAVPYYLFRQFLGIGASSDLMVLLHVGVFAVAIVLLGRVLRAETGRAFWEYAFLVVAGLSPFLPPYLYTLQPASLGASLLAITLYFAWRIRSTPSWPGAFGLALASGGAVVLVPYLTPLFMLILLACMPWRTQAKWALKTTALAIGVGIALLAPWWIRNASLFDRFFPFQQDVHAGYGYAPAELEMRKVLTALGEDAAAYWEPGSLACMMTLDPPIPCNTQWPTWLSPELRTRLERIREVYLYYQVAHDSTDAGRAITEMRAFAETYAAQEPWRYYVGSRFTLLRSFLVHSGSRLLPVHDSFSGHRSYHLIFKLTASGAYWLSLGGIVMALVFAIVRRSMSMLLWFAPALYLVLLFPFTLGLIEPRYFTGAYLPGLLLAALLASRFRFSGRTALGRPGSLPVEGDHR